MAFIKQEKELLEKTKVELQTKLKQLQEVTRILNTICFKLTQEAASEAENDSTADVFNVELFSLSPLLAELVSTFGDCFEDRIEKWICELEKM
jgi:hypothetical protein